MATLNAERDLEDCLAAVAAQDYPADRVELVVGDAGSTDRTLEIVARHGGTVVPNPLRTAEAGKAAALTRASGELVLLLDSDNVVIGADWLRRMVTPFVADPQVMGCEPARFHLEPGDGVVNRWHALLGAADPLTIYTGNYARDSALTGTWTGLPHRAEAHDGWERIELDPRAVPVLGANGFVVRRRAYELVPVGDYLFDLDHVHELVARGHRVFARADAAVHHRFVSGVDQFRRKTQRRADDFLFFQAEGQRTYPWTQRRTRGIADFALSTALVAPVVRDAARGHARRPDLGAWAFHVAACWITLVIYALAVVRARRGPQMLSREGWKQ
jgi:glycosyltransferase involved in cell wall biosynthesis